MQFVLRDDLAVDRTALASERTFLAYIRTALALIVSGITFVHFFESAPIEAIGWGFIPLGALTVVVGVVRYRRDVKRMRPLRSKARSGPHDVHLGDDGP